MRRYLLDSSVWVAFFDTNDRHHVDTKRLLEAASGGRRFAALDLTLYEVGNVAISSWRSPGDAMLLSTLVQRSCPDAILRIDEPLYELTVELADEHDLTVYDAAYVAAAQLNDWTLVSGDHRDLVEPGHALDPAAALALD
jgi:predicted nucleic acid-binding protein